jgi:hypothetical protein
MKQYASGSRITMVSSGEKGYRAEEEFLPAEKSLAY